MNQTIQLIVCSFSLLFFVSCTIAPRIEKVEATIPADSKILDKIVEQYANSAAPPKPQKPKPSVAPGLVAQMPSPKKGKSVARVSPAVNFPKAVPAPKSSIKTAPTTLAPATSPTPRAEARVSQTVNFAPSGTPSPQVSPTPAASKSIAIEKPNQVMKGTCTYLQQVRYFEVLQEKTECVLLYGPQPDQKEEKARAQHNPEYCRKVAERIRTKLEGFGFECQHLGQTPDKNQTVPEEKAAAGES